LRNTPALHAAFLSKAGKIHNSNRIATGI